MSDTALHFDIVCADIIRFDADVVALKYAQDLYGADKKVLQCLRPVSPDIDNVLPKPGSLKLLPSKGTIGSRLVLLIGTVRLIHFQYQQIRDFGRTVIEQLARVAPETQHLAMTIHGVRYGLDELEVFQSQVAGIMEAFNNHQVPVALRRISIVEIDPKRASRLKQFLLEILPKTASRNRHLSLDHYRTNVEKRFGTAEDKSEDKAHVFVAMPFATDMDDVYHYGIVGAVRKAGFVCERADLSSFTGDILEWVRDRIRTASLVIADLTSANPNVYLEVGYAWGCSIPTVLVTGKKEDLKFDVTGQRCLVYKSIRNLEESLADELQNLRARL